MGNIYFTKTLKHPKNPKFDVTFEALEEHLPPDYDEEYNAAIETKFNRGNMAAWFTAKVTVRLTGTSIEGHDYLGCCSYNSFEEFLKGDDFEVTAVDGTVSKMGYIHDMISEATTDLENAINELREVLNGL